MPPILLAERYCIVKKIGRGSFGEIYLAVDKENGEKVAVKLESVRATKPLLRHESKVYKVLEGYIGIAKARLFGECQGHNFLVMDLLGPSLEQLLRRCSGRFSLKTVLMLADQMISRVEVLHMKSLIHKDIKPDNFVMGTEKNRNRVYLIDFGLAQKFRNNIFHIACAGDQPLTGTARFASVNAHLGIQQSRRDDMESLGYVLIYFLKGSLPWQNLCGSTRKQKYEKICEKKSSMPIELLCEGLPKEFELYLKYCRLQLDFARSPDYIYLKQMFRLLFRRLGFSYDYQFDWNLNEKKDGCTASSNKSTAGVESSKPTEDTTPGVDRIGDELTLQCQIKDKDDSNIMAGGKKKNGDSKQSTSGTASTEPKKITNQTENGDVENKPIENNRRVYNGNMDELVERVRAEYERQKKGE